MVISKPYKLTLWINSYGPDHLIQSFRWGTWSPQLSLKANTRSPGSNFLEIPMLWVVFLRMARIWFWPATNLYFWVCLNICSMISFGVPSSGPKGGCPEIGTSHPRNKMFGVTPVLECWTPLYNITAVWTHSTKLLSPSALKLLIKSCM